jgi:hypothetical protein
LGQRRDLEKKRENRIDELVEWDSLPTPRSLRDVGGEDLAGAASVVTAVGKGGGMDARQEIEKKFRKTVDGFSRFDILTIPLDKRLGGEKSQTEVRAVDI